MKLLHVAKSMNNLYHIDCVVIQVDNVKNLLKRKYPSIN